MAADEERDEHDNSCDCLGAHVPEVHITHGNTARNQDGSPVLAVAHTDLPFAGEHLSPKRGSFGKVKSKSSTRELAAPNAAVRVWPKGIEHCAFAA